MGILASTNWFPNQPQWNLTRTIPATDLPVSLDEIKVFLRLSTENPVPSVAFSIPGTVGTSATGTAVAVTGSDTVVNVLTSGATTFTTQHSADGSTWITYDVRTLSTSASFAYTGGLAYVRVTLSAVSSVTAVAYLSLAPLIDDEDALLTSFIAAATAYAEKFTRRSFCTTGWQFHLDYWPTLYNTPWAVWPTQIRLPVPPVQSVTDVKYLDPNGVQQTLSPSLYQVDLASTPSRIWPAYGQTWPSARYTQNSITIDFVSGYGAANVPDGITHAIKMLVAHWYESREAVSVGNILNEVPLGVSSLLMAYRWGCYA